MPAASIRLLGTFDLQAPGAVPPAHLGPKGQALLARLAARSGEATSRSALAALLWPEHGDVDARNALRQCLHQVRGALGEAAAAVQADGDQLRLGAGCEVDLHRFSALAARPDPDAWLAAATLYRGDFVEGLDAGVEFDRWAEVERERLRTQAHGLVERLSERAEGATARDETARLARQLLAADPVHEGCYRSLMRLYARAGLRAKALQVWDECRRALRVELGIEPCAETAALAQALHAVAPAAEALPGIHALWEPNRRYLQSLSFELSPQAVDHLLRGMGLFFLWLPVANAQARAAFEEAVRAGGEQPEVLGLIGWTHWFDALSGWTPDCEGSNALAAHYATRALAANQGRTPTPHMLQGKVLLWQKRHDEALEQLRFAVTMAPGNPHTHFNLGDATMWNGDYEQAIAHLHRALALDPDDHGMTLTIEGMAWWAMGDLARARRVLQSAIARNPTYPWAHGALAAVEWEGGEPELARASVATARRHNRRMSLALAENVLPYRDPAARERKLRAWRAAGMPAEEGAFAD